MRLFPFMPLLCWALLVSLMSFTMFIVYELGVLGHLLQQDKTYISALILTLFMAITLFCGYRNWQLSTELNSLLTFNNQKCLLTRPYTSVRKFLSSYKKATGNEERVIMAELLVEKLNGPNQIAWFFSGIAIKLGLLGTVIGFVLMLLSVSGLDNLDVSDIKALMQQMTEGMGIAMNTTMVGLISSMFLGIQCLMLDRFANKIGIEVIEAAQSFDSSIASEGRDHGAISS